MKLFSKPIVALLLLFFSFVTAEAQLLGQLKSEQRLEVWFGTRENGSSMEGKYFFLFSGERIAVSKIVENDDEGSVKVPISEFTLSLEDRSAVDRLFARFASAGECLCSSFLTESISMEVWEGERRVSKEVFVDGDAARAFFEMGPPDLHFRDLIARARKVRKTKEAEQSGSTKSNHSE